MCGDHTTVAIDDAMAEREAVDARADASTPARASP